MDKLYDYQGTKLSIEGIGGGYFVKGINHRGYNYSTTGSGTVVVNNSDGAPENTLPAYILSAQKGFKYVETDVAFTSDGVAVLLHDSTIDRTSNGTGSINSLTLAQVREYDFNYILGNEISGFEGTKIPTFEEFIALCRNLSLHPYIELKSDGAYTQAQIESVVDLVESAGMKGKVTYISFNSTFLGYVKNYDDEARIGYLVFDTTSSPSPSLNSAAIAVAQSLMTGKNYVFINSRTYTNAACNLCKASHIPLETWGICNNDTESAIIGLNPYITGATSNKWDAGRVLYENSIGN